MAASAREIIHDFPFSGSDTLPCVLETPLPPNLRFMSPLLRQLSYPA